jgi:hypothetical protein
MMPFKPRVRAEKLLTLLGPKYGQLQHGTVTIREGRRRTSDDRPRDAQKQRRAEHDPEQEALENAQSTKRRRTINPIFFRASLCSPRGRMPQPLDQQSTMSS